MQVRDTRHVWANAVPRKIAQPSTPDIFMRLGYGTANAALSLPPHKAEVA